MSIPKGQIPANVLAANTTEGYLKYLADETRRANDHWDHFGKAVSAAYSQAYDANGKVLALVRDIKLANAAKKAADEARMAWALSLLTVGVAGAAAGGLIVIEGSRAAETAARDMVKQVIKGVEGAATDAAFKALSPDRVPATSVFAPADMSPTTYMAKILEGISYNKGLLEDILHEVNYGTGDQVNVGQGTTVIVNRSGDGQITPGSAKLLAEVVTGTSFFQQMPPMSVSSDTLISKAQLALWVGWALTRDPEYWSKAEQQFDEHIIAGPGGGGGNLSPASNATKEQPDWAPVLNALLALKVPGGLITSNYNTYVWTGNQYRTGLYMWGFMEWAASTSALDLLLDDKVRTSDSSVIQMVYARKARVSLTSKKVPHPHWIEWGDPIVTPL
jgi:hypothetical protein